MKKVLAVLLRWRCSRTAATGVLIWQLSPRPPHRSIPRSARTRTVSWCGSGRTGSATSSTSTDCDIPETIGELIVTSRDPVQLSVPPPIARAPWVLLRAYEDADGVRRGVPARHQLAVTIPTVDPRRGRLTGIAVQLPTLVRDEQDNEFPWPHAEWSVRTVWS